METEKPEAVLKQVDALVDQFHGAGTKGAGKAAAEDQAIDRLGQLQKKHVWLEQDGDGFTMATRREKLLGYVVEYQRLLEIATTKSVSPEIWRKLAEIEGKHDSLKRVIVRAQKVEDELEKVGEE